jgi:RimJ/RimL family protein N-acetyltransferase
MKIIFDNYQIRDYAREDVDSLVKYANNQNVSKFLRDSFPFPYTKNDAEKWIDFVIKNPGSLFFAIADSEELIGAIGAVPFDDVHRYSAEIGFWLGEPFWEKGIISKALNYFCNFLFSNYDFNRLTANVFEGNEASKKVLEKNGFVLEGTLKNSVFKENRFLDFHIYGLLKEQFHYAP